MLQRVLSPITGFLAELCGWLLILVMGFLIVDLISRGLSKPVYGVAEMAMFTMIAIVYLGLPHAQEMRSHVRVDFIVEHLPKRIHAALELIVHILASITVAILVFAVGKNALIAFERSQAVAGPVPLVVWPVKFIMVLALVLYLVQLILHTVIAAQDILTRDRD
ncbi:TRAP transporter small permease subunit [Acuticoccus sp. I52.16.1]|uniref:TRAP transporter small permease subunit n=1 Tax=Acuticoccus sp. I52.16.1 TaxID=2928472 RepID=UPI001FD52422|nr:TRAP transporter small permease [Acuticoccus sp. I52.16.1]UOM34768.1 TRAP transporter small permease [Acuticoccus sp. I52.16.1]